MKQNVDGFAVKTDIVIVINDLILQPLEGLRHLRHVNTLCTTTMTLVLTAIFQDNLFSWYRSVSILDFTGAKDDGGGVDNWSYKMCKAPVKSSPSTPSFLQARCPSCCPTNSVRAINEN